MSALLLRRINEIICLAAPLDINGGGIRSPWSAEGKADLISVCNGVQKKFQYGSWFGKLKKVLPVCDAFVQFSLFV